MAESNDTQDKVVRGKLEAQESQSSDIPVEKGLISASSGTSEKELEDAGSDNDVEEDTQISGASLEEDDAAIERERVSAQNAYQPEVRESSERGRKPSNARDLILKELIHRVERDRIKLRPVLNGKIIFEITDRNERFIFDWSAEQLIVGEAKEQAADCIITTNEREFLRVANGDLNPQVSMLSGKIKVTGKTSLAIYVFNLIAPRQFVH